ncbi:MULTISPECIES: GNAT family N-acetyltransferase [unclassified Frigoribacterium]|uniref:GNAT family N-acetyltransferase n=1 Tax=unclassified Frigoribacterium TaxID=2627005 RepID=UPI00177D361B|nr:MULTISPECIES: GNAT family N-acetyltransferase [unclassified Frigoribacterium]MBD8704002.1 GNAT family N-acetyltransferase [Frigoribacterium sp. CFBP 13712]MDY0892267.1 GNAT family N-acetyltransferase [Frigoribacterium sp. CFBP9030]
MSDAAAPAPIFSPVAEGDLTLDDHEAIASLLARAFPSYDHWYLGARSWAGMQPERRVVARLGDVVVAHAGVRRQFVTVGTTDLLVAAVGMVAVSPEVQNTGLGAELLRHVDGVLTDLRVRFGVLESGEGVQGFYRSAGWRPLEHAGEPITGHYTAFSADGAGVLVTQQEGWLAREGTSTLAEWPEGDLHWNGQMV